MPPKLVSCSLAGCGHNWAKATLQPSGCVPVVPAKQLAVFLALTKLVPESDLFFQEA